MPDFEAFWLGMRDLWQSVAISSGGARATNLPELAVLSSSPRIPRPRLYPRIDLQGGSHLLLEVDMNTVVKERLALALA